MSISIPSTGFTLHLPLGSHQIQIIVYPVYYVYYEINYKIKIQQSLQETTMPEQPST